MQGQVPCTLYAVMKIMQVEKTFQRSVWTFSTIKMREKNKIPFEVKAKSHNALTVNHIFLHTQQTG